MTEKAKYNFKCLENQCETKACHIRPIINVTHGDIARWTKLGYLMNILPGLTLSLPKSEQDIISVEMLRKPLDTDPEITSCVFYNEGANACEIRYSRPISCRSYPLEYNGEKYFLSSKDCPGVGQGEVSKEALQEARSLAEQEFNERIETISSLPVIYTIIMNQMMRQSAEAMQNLSEEDRKKMDEILKKAPEDEGSAEDEPTSPEE
ncbi:MAG: YkgJ family cysteine cluster protein [Candidatus Thorarchaeota archaeon]|jgi:Fe-S-cluster containining protein